MSLGQDVRKLRLARGVTQGQLAKILRVDRGMIALLEFDKTDDMEEARPGAALLSRIRHWLAKGGTVKDKAPRGPYGKP